MRFASIGFLAFSLILLLSLPSYACIDTTGTGACNYGSVSIFSSALASAGNLIITPPPGAATTVKVTTGITSGITTPIVTPTLPCAVSPNKQACEGLCPSGQACTWSMKITNPSGGYEIQACQCKGPSTPPAVYCGEGTDAGVCAKACRNASDMCVKETQMSMNTGETASRCYCKPKYAPTYRTCSGKTTAQASLSCYNDCASAETCNVTGYGDGRVCSCVKKSVAPANVSCAVPSKPYNKAAGDICSNDCAKIKGSGYDCDMASCKCVNTPPTNTSCSVYGNTCSGACPAGQNCMIMFSNSSSTGSSLSCYCARLSEKISSCSSGSWKPGLLCHDNCAEKIGAGSTCDPATCKCSGASKPNQTFNCDGASPNSGFRKGVDVCTDYCQLYGYNKCDAETCKCVNTPLKFDCARVDYPGRSKFNKTVGDTCSDNCASVLGADYACNSTACNCYDSTVGKPIAGCYDKYTITNSGTMVNGIKISIIDGVTSTTGYIGVLKPDGLSAYSTANAKLSKTYTLTDGSGKSVTFVVISLDVNSDTVVIGVKKTCPAGQKLDEATCTCLGGGNATTMSCKAPNPRKFSNTTDVCTDDCNADETCDALTCECKPKMLVACDFRRNLSVMNREGYTGQPLLKAGTFYCYNNCPAGEECLVIGTSDTSNPFASEMSCVCSGQYPETCSKGKSPSWNKQLCIDDCPEGMYCNISKDQYSNAICKCEKKPVKNTSYIMSGCDYRRNPSGSYYEKDYTQNYKGQKLLSLTPNSDGSIPMCFDNCPAGETCLLVDAATGQKENCICSGSSQGATCSNNKTMPWNKQMCIDDCKPGYYCEVKNKSVGEVSCSCARNASAVPSGAAPQNSIAVTEIRATSAKVGAYATVYITILNSGKTVSPAGNLPIKLGLQSGSVPYQQLAPGASATLTKLVKCVGKSPTMFTAGDKYASVRCT